MPFFMTSDAFFISPQKNTWHNDIETRIMRDYGSTASTRCDKEGKQGGRQYESSLLPHI